VALYDTSGQMDNVDINDYLVSSLQDSLSRVD
jgi:multidrug efflux pump